MSARTPEQAILDDLARPPGRWELSGTSPGGWRSGTVRGGHPFQAEPATVQFVKHRQSERRHLYFVTFDGTIPHLGHDTRRLSWLFAVEPQADGSWRATGGGGGGDSDMPPRSKPWVNLAGWGWPHQLCAGGRIHHAGVEIARVELRFADGHTLADDTDQGIALFITDQPVQMPAILALLDPAGNDITTDHPFPDD
jgi:hypothetical protein